ncbi:hypothetical protein GALMADRAFT_234057 [Galerina marginata CBS 339.88]|uniref:ATP11-domain-containing protein n=1 Tax=Galerina marginata (strain CBS 339.88) TaxID=685588 RepID=A0A067U1Q1_GALM3|nr:hypothetical protein GALMADRAFT_234057 [Galerina marginata CBS 339.88]
MNTRVLTKFIDLRYSMADTRHVLFKRAISNHYQSKYTQKLHQKAEESGRSVSQLLEQAKANETERRKAEAEELKASTSAFQKSDLAGSHAVSPDTLKKAKAPQLNERKDAPPFRPLSSILNLPRILSTAHTREQISGLWTTYHAARSNGTGRGYVCASVPLSMFHKMENTGRYYPSFVVPLPRIQPKDTSETTSTEENIAHEFFYLQWDFHASPRLPSASNNPFEKPVQIPPNPPSATVLFTPLQEYKLRGAFATPYLVLTLYTELAATHGLVLLRGEITPSTNGYGHMLSQEDAQLLTTSLQKFYLWEEGKEQLSEGRRLLRAFNQTPEEFKWQDLLEFSKL